MEEFEKDRNTVGLCNTSDAYSVLIGYQNRLFNFSSIYVDVLFLFGNGVLSIILPACCLFQQLPLTRSSATEPCTRIVMVLSRKALLWAFTAPTKSLLLAKECLKTIMAESFVKQVL